MGCLVCLKIVHLFRFLYSIFFRTNDTLTQKKKQHKTKMRVRKNGDTQREKHNTKYQLFCFFFASSHLHTHEFSTASFIFVFLCPLKIRVWLISRLVAFLDAVFFSIENENDFDLCIRILVVKFYSNWLISLRLFLTSPLFLFEIK